MVTDVISRVVQNAMAFENIICIYQLTGTKHASVA